MLLDSEALLHWAAAVHETPALPNALSTKSVDKPLDNRLRMRAAPSDDARSPYRRSNFVSTVHFFGTSASATPIMLSRVTRFASWSSLSPSVPSGRFGATM